MNPIFVMMTILERIRINARANIAARLIQNAIQQTMKTMNQIKERREMDQSNQTNEKSTTGMFVRIDPQLKALFDNARGNMTQDAFITQILMFVLPFVDHIEDARIVFKTEKKSK